MAGGGDARRGAKQSRGRGKGWLTGGARGIFIFFSLFFSPGL